MNHVVDALEMHSPINKVAMKFDGYDALYVYDVDDVSYGSKIERMSIHCSRSYCWRLMVLENCRRWKACMDTVIGDHLTEYVNEARRLEGTLLQILLESKHSGAV